MFLARLERPFHVNFEITGRCNQRCWFCAAQVGRFAQADLPTSQVLAIVDRLLDAGVYSLFLTGGEPTLRQDLDAIIKHALAGGMNITVSTNGTLLQDDDRVLRLVEAGLREIQVSLQSHVESTHDETVGLPGAFSSTRRAIGAMQRRGLTVVVSVVGTRCNYRDLPDFVRAVAAWGVEYVRVLRIMPNSQKALDNRIPFADLAGVCDTFADLQDELGVKIDFHMPCGFYDRRHRDPDRYPSLLHAFCGVCTAGKSSMAILCDGTCLPCIEFKGLNVRCGNLLENALDEVWGSRGMKSIGDVTPESYEGQCGSCDYKWACYSPRCVALRFAGDLAQEDTSCYLVSPAQ